MKSRFDLIFSVINFLSQEIRKIQMKARDHIRRILKEHEQLKSDLKSEKKKLELCRKELEKREEENENERKNLYEEIEKVLLFCTSWSFYFRSTLDTLHDLFI